MSYILRKGDLKDLEQILTLFVDTIQSTCIQHYTQKQIEVWTASAKNTERWINRIVQQYFVVAEANGLITGFSSLENNNYVDLMYVHKDFQKQKIAQTLLRDIELKAIQLGAKQLSTDASITAKPFFAKQGFATEKENKFELNGVVISNFRMVKSLF